MARALSHANIIPRRSSARGHAEHGWLDSYHTFSFAQYDEPRFRSFGALRVLNEDRVAPGTGFPTHQHRDAEIFSYILDGELTHRDSMHGQKKSNTSGTDDFSRLHRGDVQFTTGGSGIAHSERNENKSKTVHFLQIWALPWKKSLPPIYHTNTFPEEDKRQRFVTIISPLKAGPGATASEEEAAVPAIEGTIPIHADFLMGAAIIPTGTAFPWTIGGGGDDTAVRSKSNRKAYIHLPMTKGGLSKIRLSGAEAVVLEEGDGAFVANVNAGDQLFMESIGDTEAEVVVLDSN
jgi:quercetin 2,3-dioxygenase